MDYGQTVQWMYARLPMFQRQGAAAYKKDLGNILLLSAHLGNPHTQFKSIHVAGTNGKGSTSHMLASILQEAGYKTGLYTSPHLKDFRERIRINGVVAEEGFVVDFITKNKAFLEENQLSFFELTVGMAFAYFAEQEVDVAVIEVGMGGRLDATNIINPVVSVITNIGLDHTAFLGTTLAEIAVEKAGIIKPGVPVVIGERQQETTPVFESIAEERGAPIHFASDFDFPDYPSELKGFYQKKNIATVQKAVELIRSTTVFEIEEMAVRKGIECVISNTGLQGRWQILQENPKIVCDTGHNAEGLHYVMEQLKQESYDQLHIVLGVVADKDLDKVLPLFPKEAIYYFCKPDVPRALDEKVLQEKAEAYGLSGTVFSTVNEALTAAKTKADPVDLIFAGGSTFVVAEII